MKVKIVKGVDGIAVIPIDFAIAPIFVSEKGSLEKTVKTEYLRTCYLLELKPGKTLDSFEVVESENVNYLVKDFDSAIFSGILEDKKVSKTLKSLFMQNAFSFKSLTDNLSENSREKAVESYVNLLTNTALEFGGTVGGGGLMQTAFSVYEFIDEVSNKFEFLLTILYRITALAKGVYLSNNLNFNPFYFNEEFSVK